MKTGMIVFFISIKLIGFVRTNLRCTFIIRRIPRLGKGRAKG
jgi:hypothetical protein